MPDPEKVEDEVVIEPPKEEEAGLSEVEQKAHDMGWRPEAEYEGPSDWVDAQEFVNRKPFYDGLSKQSKTIKRLQKTINNLVQHNQIAEKSAYERAKADIKAERVAAMRDQNYERAEELTTEELALDQRNTQQVENVDPPEFLDWLEDNSWYTDDKSLREYADDIGPGILNAYKSEGLDAVYGRITDKVKGMFPTKFTKRIPSGGQGGDGAARKTGSGSGNLMGKMTDEERKLGQEFVQDGIFKDINEYAKQLDLRGR